MFRVSATPAPTARGCTQRHTHPTTLGAETPRFSFSFLINELPPQSCPYACICSRVSAPPSEACALRHIQGHCFHVQETVVNASCPVTIDLTTEGYRGLRNGQTHFSHGLFSKSEPGKTPEEGSGYLSCWNSEAKREMRGLCEAHSEVTSVLNNVKLRCTHLPPQESHRFTSQTRTAGGILRAIA